LKQVYKQLDTITRSRALIASANTSPNLLYADVACSPPVSQLSNVRTLSSFNTTLSTFTDIFYCTVDTSRAGDGESNKISASTVRAAVEKEIWAIDDYTNWRCYAVTVDPKNTNRVRIVCRDKVEPQLVKRIAETKIGAGVCILYNNLYPIKVENVKQTAVLDKNNKIRAGAAEAFSKKNETTVAKIL
jgi:hypothetical protein